MSKLKLAILAFVAMFVLTGCSFNKNNNDLIKINNTVITQKEYNKAYDAVTSNAMFSQMGIDLKKDVENPFALMMREKVISELMVKVLLDDEMAKRKIKVTKEELNKAEEDLVAKFGSKEQFLQLIKMNGVSYDKFKQDLEEEIKLKKFVDSIALVSIGEAEAKKYYDENIDKFKFPKRVRASHILISTNADLIKTDLQREDKSLTENEIEKKVLEKLAIAREEAEKIQKQVKNNPTSFAKVAKEKSQDPASAVRGGDLGFFAKDEMVEAFANKAFEMAPNTISEVVETPYGYHIIMVTDRTEAGTLSFEQSKKDIINYLEGQDKVDILKNKIESLRKEAKIEFYNQDYNPENIQKKIREAAKNDPMVQQAFGQPAPVENK